VYYAVREPDRSARARITGFLQRACPEGSTSSSTFQLVPDRVASVNARVIRGAHHGARDWGGAITRRFRRGGPIVRHRPNRAASANTGERHSLPARLAANAQPTGRLGRPRRRHLHAARAGRDAVGMGVADGLRDGRRYGTMRSGPSPDPSRIIGRLACSRPRTRPRLRANRRRFLASRLKCRCTIIARCVPASRPIHM
jgi:hypothetical protein